MSFSKLPESAKYFSPSKVNFSFLLKSSKFDSTFLTLESHTKVFVSETATVVKLPTSIPTIFVFFAIIYLLFT